MYFMCKGVDLDFLFRRIVHAGVFLRGGQGPTVACQYEDDNHCVNHSAFEFGKRVAGTGSALVD